MSNQRVIDNPNDNAIREIERQVRLQQGAALLAQQGVKPPKSEYGESFRFRFRKIKAGLFAGLWELAAIKKDGEVDEIIVDADALPEVLDRIGNIFANRGY